MEAFVNAAAAIAVSPSLADRIASFGLPRPFVVPNVVDERRFSVGSPRAGKFTFFTLGRIDPSKGIDDLLHAIAIWNPPATDVEFRIGGTGSHAAAFAQLARTLGVDNRVGSIDVGKDADLVMYDKYPLSDYAKVQKVLIDGNLYFDRDNEVSGRAARQGAKQKLIDKEKQNQQPPTRRPQ